jgi:hypothetical protein
MRQRIGEWRSFIVDGPMGISLAAVGYVLRLKRCPGEQVPPPEPTEQGLTQERSGGRHV